jgi:catechol 2,3-dioxygenase
MGMHIGHVALQVTDLDRSIEHAQRTLGLHVTVREAGVAYLTANDKHHEMQLIEADRPAFDHVGLEVERESELEALRDRAIAAGCEILAETPQEAALESAIRFLGPDDIAFEVYLGMGRELISVENTVRPLARKLGHVTFNSGQMLEVERFLVDVLGFRVSDRVEGEASWLRCDPDHHGLAVSAGREGTRCHHYAFEVESWASLGTYLDDVARDGDDLIWGPGRHGPGFNIYTYRVDPDGCVLEVYTDLLRIDNDEAYVPFDWSTHPSPMNLWGPPAPDDFRDHGVPVGRPRAV